VDKGLTLMAVGDVNIQRRDARTLFGDTADFLAGADLLFGNQEGVVSDRGTPLLGKREAGSSWVRGSAASVEVEASIGFSAMTLANNHAMDYGADGLLHSIELFHDHGIATAGAGTSVTDAHTPAVLTHNGTRVAMLGYTSVFPPFGFAATSDHPGAAVIRVSTSYETPPNVPYQPGTPATTITIPDMHDTRLMEEDIRSAKLGADLVVVQFHWGVVGSPRPLGYMKELGRAAVDAGADLVLGNHAHVLQGVEVYRGAVICYSLNHFAFEHGDHLFPAWPHVHDTVILSSEIIGKRFVRHSLAVATLDPETHDLSMASEHRRHEAAAQLGRISSEFGTTFEAQGDLLMLGGPSAGTPPPRRAPEVLSDPAALVTDGQLVIARAEQARAHTNGPSPAGARSSS
jgi:poly-gamma-glutamate synthesis protein (capsule biosynthesis protein)